MGAFNANAAADGVVAMGPINVLMLLWVRWQ